MFKALTVVGAAILMVLVTCTGAIAKPSETLSFTAKYISKDRKANTGALSLRTQFTIKDDAGAPAPTPLSGLELHFPKGAKTDGSAYPTCTVTQAQNAKCPSRAKLGGGTATASAPPIVASVSAVVSIYNGTSSSIIIHAIPSIGPNQTYQSPLKKQGGSSRYGYVLSTTLPPIATLPGAPNASVTGLDVNVNPKPIKKGKRKRNYITGPLLCNNTFFFMDSIFSYQDGTKNTVYGSFALNGGPRC
jgi:hypothetical protein